MPHLTLECSGNLLNKVDLTSLCGVLRDTILQSGLFEVGAVRVRAFEATAWAVADGDSRNAFIDMSFRVGTGRSADERKQVGQSLFDAARKHLAALMTEPYFALSLEVREIDPDLSCKANSMHARFRTGILP